MKYFIGVFALSMLINVQVKAQSKDLSDHTWPILGSSQKSGDDVPRLMIEHQNLKEAQKDSNPPGMTRCDPSAEGCSVWLGDFFSEPKASIKESTLHPGIVLHHYPNVFYEGHYSSSGTYIFYLPKQKVFYLWGDCMMGHSDVVAGPFSGDPRSQLKKLAESPDAVAVLGFTIVPFHAHTRDMSENVWPAIPSSGIDSSKLERAQTVPNPLSLERCNASTEACVLNEGDFLTTRKTQLGVVRSILRPDVILHYYPALRQQRVYYLYRQNLFYLAGYDESAVLRVSGPFAGDPKLVLKKLGESADAK